LLSLKKTEINPSPTLLPEKVRQKEKIENWVGSMRLKPGVSEIRL
jgi:hypothetical protein